MGQNTAREIVKANLALHADEAHLYDQIHHDIFNPIEQSRISARLRRAASLVLCAGKWALDFGAGTGNISLKLANLGFNVVASDLSKEMLTIMKGKAGAEHVQATVGEGVLFKPETFSLVAVCSVLHHLYDYVHTLRELVRVLKPGGVLFIDLEAETNGPIYSPGRDYLLYLGLSYVINAAYRRIVGVRRPGLDYSKADYHCRPENRVDWSEIVDVLERAGMSILETRPYLLHRATIPNPAYPVLALWLNDHRYLLARREK